MKFCSNCQKAIDTQGNFCIDCGTPLTDMVPPVVQEAVSTEIEQQPQVATQQPYAPQGTYEYNNPYNQAVYYQDYQQPQTPSKASVIVGMALAIAGFAFSMIGTLEVLVSMSFDGEAAFGLALVFAFLSLPLSIVGLVMSKKNRDNGDASVMSKLGKLFGLLGVIASGVMLFLGIIGLSVGETYDYNDDYYYY